MIALRFRRAHEIAAAAELYSRVTQAQTLFEAVTTAIDWFLRAIARPT
jgi:hypothetical protein